MNLEYVPDELYLTALPGNAIVAFPSGRTIRSSKALGKLIRRWPGLIDLYHGADEELGAILPRYVTGSLLTPLVCLGGREPNDRPPLRYGAFQICLDRLRLDLGSEISVHMPPLTGTETGANERTMESILERSVLSHGIPVSVYTGDRARFEKWVRTEINSQATPNGNAVSLDDFSKDGRCEYFYPKWFSVNGDAYLVSFGWRHTKGRSMGMHYELHFNGPAFNMKTSKIATGPLCLSNWRKGLRIIYEHYRLKELA